MRRPYDASSLGAVAISIEAEWLAEAFRRINELAKLDAHWNPDSDASPPNDTSLKNARHAIAAIADAGLEANYINPSVEEGICVAFRVDDRYADIECFNSGEIVAATSDGRGTYSVWEIANSQQMTNALSIIRAFFKTAK
jgi:hypothetical protein